MNQKLSVYLKLVSLRFFGSVSRFENRKEKKRRKIKMVHNRRNSLAMAGLVDNENAENLQVNGFFGDFVSMGSVRSRKNLGSGRIGTEKMPDQFRLSVCGPDDVGISRYRFLD